MNALMPTATFATLAIAGFAFSFAKAYVQSECDRKLGCAGGVVFSTMAASAAGVVSAATVWAMQSLPATKGLHTAKSKSAMLLCGVLTALLLIILYQVMIRNTVGAIFLSTLGALGLPGYIVAWSLASAALAFVASKIVQSALSNAT